MRFTEIGQQLRAFRLESGLRAEEIAARLGVSRAALYRYEKGEVIKLDTIKRLAELLKISPLSLLGIGVEYYNRPVAYFERIRQIEETADQILRVGGATCFLATSEAHDSAVHAAFEELTERTADRAAIRANAEQIAGILAARKRTYSLRRPNIICIVSLAAVQRLLDVGICGDFPLSERTRHLCRQAAAAEVDHLVRLMEAEPMGLQFGLLAQTEPTGSFKLLRERDRATLSVNPFPADAMPLMPGGVAMITGADEAVAAHQRVAEALWREAVKGAAAAGRIRQLREVARIA
jgi:transcriptional regulator with XRE-family HTH domain